MTNGTLGARARALLLASAGGAGPDRTPGVILAAKGLRTFCYGFLGVLFPVHLTALGLGPEAIGLAVTATLAASAAFTVAVRRPTERLGGRRVLLALSSLIVLSGALLGTTRVPWLVVAAGMLGNLAVSAGETGPFLTIEQVLLARHATGPALTLRMSLYNLLGYGSAGLGALTVAIVGRLGRGTSAVPYEPLFWVFALSGLVQIGLYARLEPGPPGAPPGRRPPRASPLVRRLAALFALDALAGGFVVQSLIAYWFLVRYGLDLAALGGVFFGTQLLTALSLLLAPAAAARLGLVNTMVFSHLVSNLLLVGIAVAPGPAWAVALLLARHLLSQIDVPTRQTFLMSVVPEAERPAAATVTNVARTVAQAVSPAFTGFVMQGAGLSAPFVLGGGLKIVYDLLLYRVCRRVERAGALADRPPARAARP